MCGGPVMRRWSGSGSTTSTSTPAPGGPVGAGGGGLGATCWPVRSTGPTRSWPTPPSSPPKPVRCPRSRSPSPSVPWWPCTNRTGTRPRPWPSRHRGWFGPGGWTAMLPAPWSTPWRPGWPSTRATCHAPKSSWRGLLGCGRCSPTPYRISLSRPCWSWAGSAWPQARDVLRRWPDLGILPNQVDELRSRSTPAAAAWRELRR
jgi:hypothetical protein